MKEVFFILFSFFVFAPDSFSQPERADIIEKKIRSIKKTVIENADTAKKETFWNFYSINGDDSLEYYNGILSYRYLAQHDAKGRVSQLIRYDIKGNQDEWHKYNYNRDGSYSIEKIAQGAGTILLARYDKRNWLMEEEIESSYSLIYQRSATGKTQKILVKEKDKASEVIAVFHFDKNGLITKGEGTAEGGNSVFFKYNDRGLANEIRTVFGDKKDNQKIETILLEYEFYDAKN